MAVDGTWERGFTALIDRADADRNVSGAVSVDSRIVRAHQHAAGAHKRGLQPASRTTTLPVGPVVGRPRRSTWRPMDAADHWECRLAASCVVVCLSALPLAWRIGMLHRRHGSRARSAPELAGQRRVNLC
ncbi:hypothetical protein GCM10027521_12570 [Amycolatopsis cihanbeyliensis]